MSAKSTAKRYLDLPPVWAAGCAFAAWFLARVLPVYSFDVSHWLTGVIVGAGVYLVIWSALWFWRRKTPIEPRHTPKQLIVEGPYRLNRNPIYSGLIAMLFGFSLWLGDVVALVPVLAYPLILRRRFIADEEERIRTEFGAEAEAYFRSTRRW